MKDKKICILSVVSCLIFFGTWLFLMHLSTQNLGRCEHVFNILADLVTPATIIFAIIGYKQNEKSTQDQLKQNARFMRTNINLELFEKRKKTYNTVVMLRNKLFLLYKSYSDCRKDFIINKSKQDELENYLSKQICSIEAATTLGLCHQHLSNIIMEINKCNDYQYDFDSFQEISLEANLKTTNDNIFNKNFDNFIKELETVLNELKKEF